MKSLNKAIWASILMFLSISFVESKLENNVDLGCRKGKHPMFVVLTPPANSNIIKGLKTFSYTFILFPSQNYVNNFHLVIEGSFPVNVNIDLSADIVYYFESNYNFCLNDLLGGRLVTILGDLIEYKSKSPILHGIWMQIDKIEMKEEIKVDTQDNLPRFYLLTNYNYNNPSVILMEKLTTNVSKPVLQIVKASMKETKNKKLVGFDEGDNGLSIGTELTIQSTVINDILNEGKVHQAFTMVGTQGKYFTLDAVSNLVCLIRNGETYSKQCPI